MNCKFLLIGALAVIAGGCASPDAGGASAALPQARVRIADPDVRGTMSFYPDTFGDASLEGIIAGTDGALWFTDPGNDVLGRITTHGEYTLQQVVSGANISSGITLGPDKNLWFTLATGGVGRRNSDGTITLYKDSQGSFAQGITNGPDGALWFAQSGSVVRVTTQGDFTHYPVTGGGYTELQGIVTGPDGNLWVTQTVVGSRFSDQIIRVTPTGKHKSFTVGLGPAWICVGPDKALWFTERAANAIGRLTTNGKYTEFPTNYYDGGPSGIAVGSDGALWFSDFNARFGIGRITPKGKLRFFGTPSIGGEYRQIAQGPDRKMWFTSYLSPGVGSVKIH